MALIKCPECRKEISDRAMTCPNCGYPIQATIQAEQVESEIQRLKGQVTQVNSFRCPPDRVKVCLKCGKPFDAHYRPKCLCGFPSIEVDYPLKQLEYSDPCSRIYILKSEVQRRNIGDKESPAYQEMLHELQDDIEMWKRYYRASGATEERINARLKPVPPEEAWFGVLDNSYRSPMPTEGLEQFRTKSSTAENQPVCPICGSRSLSKISIAHKAAKIGVFGIFGMGDNGKTWKCNNCGSKF